MVIRTSNQPTASPRVALLRGGAGSLLLLLVGCADLDDPSVPRSSPEVDASSPSLADVPDEDHEEAQDCRGLSSSPRLELAAPIAPDRDLLLETGDRTLRVTVRNVWSEPLLVEPRLTWRAAGEVQREAAERLRLAPGEQREVAIDLDRDLDTRAAPASLDVRLRTWHGQKRGVDESLPTVFFHADPKSGRLHVYDEGGMAARHRAGDLLGTHRSVGAREDLVGVGVAHLARPEELVGDPADAARTRGEVR